MNSNPPHQAAFQTFATTPSRPVRSLRKFQSHQNLSSSPSSAFPPFPPQLASPFSPGELQDRDTTQLNAQNNGESALQRSRGRSRSNSDVTLNSMASSQAPRRHPGSRKSGSMGFAGKRSGLEVLLRDGPSGNNVAEGLEELRYLILSTRVDADSDGMVWMLSPTRPVLKDNLETNIRLSACSLLIGSMYG